MSVSAIPPERAPVRPRVHCSGSTVPLLLEEEIRQLLDNGQRVDVRLCGRRGSGKSTALAHLAATFAGDERLLLCDVGTGSKQWEGQVRVLARPGAGPFEGVRFHLLPWTDDDVVEYLLAAHPDRVANAFSAWQVEGDHDLRNSPGLCRRVLDLLATEPIGDPLTALSTVLRQLLGQRHAAAVDYALRTFVAAQPPQRRQSSPAPAILSHEPPLLSSSAVLGVLAAERVLDIVIGQPRNIRVQLDWRAPLRSAIHHSLQTDRNLQELHARADSPRCRHKALVLGCLCIHQPAHRPSHPPRGDLKHGWLRGIDLSGMRVRARMAHADLDGADLSGARLERCDLSHANLRAARADEMECSRLHAPYLQAAELAARGSAWPEAELRYADLRAAHLEEAKLGGARMDHVQLQGATLHGADLSRVSLGYATLAAADLRDAICDDAHLEDVDLRDTRLTGARFHSAWFVHCNLAETELPGLVAPCANFNSSDLTGSRWPKANLAGASFAHSGLAEIHWEGADLRGCDLRRATFHLGNSRSGLIDSPIAGEGSRTGFYTDESLDDHFQHPEVVRKANLRWCDLRGAHLRGTDFYLVDVRGARLDESQRRWLKRCRAILDRE